MASASTPMRSRHSSREAPAFASRTPNRTASPALNQTVRIPPLHPLHLYTSDVARNSISLTAVARQIAAARAPLSAPSSQSSSFTRVPSRAEHHADRSPHHSRRPSPSPTGAHSSRSSTRVEPAGEPILQALSRFADQLAAQSAAQSAAQLSALSAYVQRFETLHPAPSPSHQSRINQSTTAPRSPTPHASPTPQPSSPQNASALHVSTGAPLSLYSQYHAHPLALENHVVAHAPLGEVQQSQLSAPSPRHDMRVQLGATHQHTPLSRVPLRISRLLRMLFPRLRRFPRSRIQQ